MFCEYLIPKAKEGDTESLQSLYYANFGLLVRFAETFNVPQSDADDFYQLCYVALVQALDAYGERSSASFLAYYRRCVLHQYYVFKLEMKYPLKLTKDSYRMVINGDLSFNHSCEDYVYCYLDESLCTVENTMMADVIWAEVKRMLQYEDYLLIRERFVNQKHYSELESVFNKTAAQLRFRQRHVLTKLRKSVKLKQIAENYF